MEQKTAVVNFDQAQVDLIKKMVAPDATNDELSMFLHACRKYQLDPLQRQIFCIHRNQRAQVNGQWVNIKKMTIQTSIDGFRIIAERSGDYAGQDEPVLVYDDAGTLQGAKVTVYRFRGETRYPAAVGVAWFCEYAQTGTDGKPLAMWAKMPRTMITKCAEALALRKAFPAMLSGLYTDDEMQQARDEQQPAQAQPAQIAEPVQVVDKPKKAVKKVDAVPVADPVPAASGPAAQQFNYAWYVRLDKCKTRAEVKELAEKHREEIAQDPALQAAFREYHQKLK